MTPLLAITADPVGVLAAFGAGILSFLSPCVLPLVPGYLSMVTGLEAAELEGHVVVETPAADERAGTVPLLSPVPPTTSAAAGTLTATAPAATAAPAAATATRSRPPLRPLLQGVLLFIAGFTVVFVALGAAASGLGHLLDPHKLLLQHVAGALMVVFGALLLVGAAPASWWARLGSGPASGLARVMGERRFQVRPSGLGTWAAPVMGMAFAFAWTPCIGPILGAIYGLATVQRTVAGGAVLLFAYSLGLGVPFLATGLAFGRLTDLYARARRGLWVVHLIGGAVLVAFGVIVLTDNLGWLSSLFSSFLHDIGLGRLSVS